MSYQYLERARKFLCIGRNYVEHIKELNNQAPSRPFFFLKPSSSVLKVGEGPILIPKGVVVHHELELAIILNKDLKNLDPAKFGEKEALDAIEGYALALDLTARNVQDEAKKKGLPWTIGKGFDTFLPISQFIPKERIPDPHNVHLELNVSGSVRQSDNTNLMVFRIPQILSTMSSIMTLQKGDVILTGTPKGVAPLVPGDKVVGNLSVGGQIIAEAELNFECEQKPGPYEYKEI